MSELQQPTEQHYQHNDDPTFLWQTICEHLEKKGFSESDLNSDLLAPIDQLHIGGRSASTDLLAVSGLAPESYILEIGSGLGGTARLLSDRLDAHITAVDITPAFTFACQQINRIQGYSTINSVCADASELELTDNSQDAVWSQHTIMNIPDKDKLFSTLARVLKKGGKLLLHEVIAGANTEPLALPVPWASQAEQSHLPSLNQLIELLAQHHFKPLHCQLITDKALNWRTKHSQREQGQQPKGNIQSKSPLTPVLVFGERFITMGKNVQQNLADNKVQILEAVFEYQG